MHQKVLEINHLYITTPHFHFSRPLNSKFDTFNNGKYNVLYKYKVKEGYGFCPAPWKAGSNAFVELDITDFLISVLTRVDDKCS